MEVIKWLMILDSAMSKGSILHNGEQIAGKGKYQRKERAMARRRDSCHHAGEEQGSNDAEACDI